MTNGCSAKINTLEKNELHLIINHNKQSQKLIKYCVSILLLNNNILVTM